MRPAWQEFKQALDEVGFHPSRRFGQNFLLDENMVRAIARDAEVGEGDFVLEVGTGCGFLTAELAELGVELLGAEIDRRLFDVAGSFLEPFGDRVRLVCTDALASKHALAPELLAGLEARGERDWHLVGNLPYSIASPLLVVLARLANPPATMTALVQAEVAERVVAEPGSKARGTLSARLEPVYAGRITRRVPPQLFWPRPRVDSAVVRLELRSERPEPERIAALDELIDRLFSARRKALRALLARELGAAETVEELLAREGLDPRLRPEALDGPALGRLADSPEWTARVAARREREHG